MFQFRRIVAWFASRPFLVVPLALLVVTFVLAGVLWALDAVNPPRHPYLSTAFAIVAAFVLGVGLRPVMIRAAIWPALIRCLDVLFSSAAQYRAKVEELTARLRTKRNQIRRLRQRLRQHGRRHNDAQRQQPPGHGRLPDMSRV